MARATRRGAIYRVVQNRKTVSTLNTLRSALTEVRRLNCKTPCSAHVVRTRIWGTGDRLPRCGRKKKICG
jgi:hypothetical protein